MLYKDHKTNWCQSLDQFLISPDIIDIRNLYATIYLSLIEQGKLNRPNHIDIRWFLENKHQLKKEDPDLYTKQLTKINLLTVTNYSLNTPNDTTLKLHKQILENTRPNLIYTDLIITDKKWTTKIIDIIKPLYNDLNLNHNDFIEVNQSDWAIIKSERIWMYKVNNKVKPSHFTLKSGKETLLQQEAVNKWREHNLNQLINQ